MRPHSRILSVALAGAIACLALSVLHANPSNRQADIVHTSKGDLRLMPIYHGSVMFEFNGMVVYVDPYNQGDFTGLPQGDMFVVTHTHGDHLDRSTIDKLKKPEVVIVGPPAVIDTLNCAPGCGIVETISDSEQRTVKGIEFQGVPMYNIVNGSGPGKPYHHKGIGSGYVMTFGDTRIYFSGDTECTTEMKALKNISVAFLAMNPPRAMSTTEAAECVKVFKPKVAYPYHYRGSKIEEFADALKGTAGVEVRLRKLEGEQ